jgi:hypothetical protein
METTIEKGEYKFKPEKLKAIEKRHTQNRILRQNGIKEIAPWYGREVIRRHGVCNEDINETFTKFTQVRIKWLRCTNGVQAEK